MNNPHSQRPITLKRQGDCWLGGFPAMASDCEIHVATTNRTLAQDLTHEAATETWRIEAKFSRYQANSVISRINNAQGKTTEVDAETAALVNFALHCYQLSGGLFDISSGILRQVWRFDGSAQVPTQKAIDQLLPHIGLDSIDWHQPTLQLPAGMELDFGGIGKEYAVDKVLQLLTQTTQADDIPIMVNFGGDIAANTPPDSGRNWRIGISNIDNDKSSSRFIKLQSAGVATSGDSQRFLVKDGIRYSHILNPKTGWPTVGAPRSVTVVAATCTDAGILATLAMLYGEHAERFLTDEGVQFHCQR